jgi:hypothetical protein
MDIPDGVTSALAEVDLLSSDPVGLLNQTP